jgi:hypothetical protein
MLLAFRYTATSDERREGLIWLGFNTATGAALKTTWWVGSATCWRATWSGGRPTLLCAVRQARFPTRRSSRSGRGLGSITWCGATWTPSCAPCVAARPRLRAGPRVSRRSARGALTKLAALQSVTGDKGQADRMRERTRVAAIEREYASKLDDLRHNYALRVTVNWVQGLVLFAPVHRYEVLIRRRKSERIVAIDWHPAARMMEPPLCDWGLGWSAHGSSATTNST